jgi:serine/threonine protein kinase
LERDVARDGDAAVRFQREAEAASSVESAHIVQIFDSGTTDDGLPFLVMELLQGEDLRKRLRREGRLELAEVVHIAGQVLRGLARAHEAEIVHRDLKPDNIFLCERDDDPIFVKIVDFGISKVARKASVDTLTRRGTVLGTAFYMSPEQAQAFRDIDGRADLYSLGAILYEALAGRPPHVGTAYEAVLISICTTDAEDVRVHAPNVPDRLARVIQKALSRDRDARYRTASEFYDALSEAAPGLLRANRMPGSSELDASSASGARAPYVAEAHSADPPALESVGKREAADTVELRAASASGTAVPSASARSRTQRRRTLATAGISLIAASFITLLFIARTRAPESAEKLSAGAASEASRSHSSTSNARPVAPLAAKTGPEVQVVEGPVRTHGADAGPLASSRVRNSSQAKADPNSASRRPAKAANDAARRAHGQPNAGVAGGLELNTRGP